MRGAMREAAEHIELRTRLDEYAELERILDARSKQRVERVNALDYHDPLLRQFDEVLLVGGNVIDEIELAMGNRLAAKERVQVFGQPLNIHAIDVLVIELAILIAWIKRIAYEIIVGGDQDRRALIHHQLRANSLRRRDWLKDRLILELGVGSRMPFMGETGMGMGFGAGLEYITFFHLAAYASFGYLPMATDMNWHKSRNNANALFDGVKTSDKPIYMETKVKDAEGFATTVDTTIAQIRVYREGRHGSERWANLAAFSEATDLFRFRHIPNVTVTTEHFLICGNERFDIVSVENVKGRGMYTEVLAKKVVASIG